ncbi:hypothetical protein BU23DRAFT_9077 [Bimuria novae-zelandiae CBS 107.79]|uniref:Uncharacterized protein n=1 Tax=Bimuria novae-zelandiae CBS 107.79 TaxID=1447943 RepID=A0A6A5W4N6_9PLEO|nr:hypothetical protein BU23DRAFT_9077 [Bimuria novae-zelandiae CBS 107.79]
MFRDGPCGQILHFLSRILAGDLFFGGNEQWLWRIQWVLIVLGLVACNHVKHVCQQNSSITYRYWFRLIVLPCHPSLRAPTPFPGCPTLLTSDSITRLRCCLLT